MLAFAEIVPADVREAGGDRQMVGEAVSQRRARTERIIGIVGMDVVGGEIRQRGIASLIRPVLGKTEAGNPLAGGQSVGANRQDRATRRTACGRKRMVRMGRRGRQRERREGNFEAAANNAFQCLSPNPVNAPLAAIPTSVNYVLSPCFLWHSRHLRWPNGGAITIAERPLVRRPGREIDD